METLFKYTIPHLHTIYPLNYNKDCTWSHSTYIDYCLRETRNDTSQLLWTLSPVSLGVQVS